MSKIHNHFKRKFVKAQSIISAPLIDNYILKLKVKVKKNIWQNFGDVEMPLEMKSSSKKNHKNPATDSSQLGQWLR